MLHADPWDYDPLTIGVHGVDLSHNGLIDSGGQW